MQRVEMEELRQREANLTALNAIGPRKKPKLEHGVTPSLQVIDLICILNWIFVYFKLFKFKIDKLKLS